MHRVVNESVLPPSQRYVTPLFIIGCLLTFACSGPYQNVFIVDGDSGEAFWRCQIAREDGKGWSAAARRR